MGDIAEFLFDLLNRIEISRLIEDILEAKARRCSNKDLHVLREAATDESNIV